MNIPLYAKNIETLEGTKLEIWSNKERSVIDIPMRPYLYSKAQRNIPAADVEVETVRFISNVLEEHTVYKYLFNSVKEIPEWRDIDSMECDIPFIQRVAIDKPGFFNQFPQDNDLDILYLDIEVASKGRFPKSDTNPIIGIGYAMNDNPPKILTINDMSEGDCNILTQFMDDLEKFDPDLIVTYFGNVFDIPYIIDRLNIHGITTSAFTRSEGEAYFMPNDTDKIIYIKGRCSFDIFEEVLKDQSLFGIPTRRMKDVAKWFNLNKVIMRLPGFEDYDIIIEDLSDTESMVGTQRLHDYLMSDVLITRELSKIYLPNVVTFGEMLGLPLNIMIGRTSSMPHTVLSARNLKQINIISDSPNFVRYPDIFGKMDTIIKNGREKTVFVGGTKFQGAVVDCNASHQGKVLKDLYHRDYRSLYPSIIMHFNISPETVSFVEYKPFVDRHFMVTDFGDYRIMEFSDDRLQKNVVIKILKEEGFAAREMKRFFDERVKIKEALEDKNLSNEKKSQLQSASVIYKVLLNSYFGCTGSAFFRYSNVYQAMAVTACGRFLIRYIIDRFGDDWSIVDTDGIYGTVPLDADVLSSDVNKMLIERFNVSASFLIEGDNYDSGFALKMKNYILKKGDRLIKHGVSFKASSKNRIFADALDKVAMALLSNPDDMDKVYEVAKKCYDISDREIAEFIMRTKINRPLGEYAVQPSAGKKGCLQVQVGTQSEDYHDNPVRIGDSVAYVKTTTGYEIRETVSNTKIDKGYYRKQVLSVLERFNLHEVIWRLENPGQTKIGEFK